MERTLPVLVRRFADETGMSNETTEFAVIMAEAAAQSGKVTDSLPSAVAAGCLHAAARALGGEHDADPRFERHDDGQMMASGDLRRRKPKPTHNWNHHVGHNRSDNGGTEMTISKAASITPVSLREHSRKVATIYLDSDTEMHDSRTRERLSRLTFR